MHAPRPAHPGPLGGTRRDRLAGLIDQDRHPVLVDGPARAARVAAVRAELAAAGCSVLRGFIHPAHHDRIREEAERVAVAAHHEVATVNVYNTAPDPSLPPAHPAHRTTERGNAFVARDRLDPDGLLEALYTSAGFQRLLADCFGLPAVYELADPLSALTLNVLRPGRGHPWHFDVNEFTVSTLVGAPRAGGVFEYCPDLRSPDDENLPGVTAVLDGARAPVRELVLAPGDLQLFRGRYALHRVTPVVGDRDRRTAILAYSARPGVVGSPERARQLFGRATAAHRPVPVDVSVPVDGDGLLD